jgi:hypothetical protein
MSKKSKKTKNKTKTQSPFDFGLDAQQLKRKTNMSKKSKKTKNKTKTQSPFDFGLDAQQLKRKTNMSKKSKKTKNKTKTQSPFDFGLDAQQTLADTLCDKYLQVGIEMDAIDDAFIGAFHGFAHRMLTIFKKDFVLEIVEEMSQVVAEEQDEPYVCPDCQEKHGPAPKANSEAKNKMH